MTPFLKHLSAIESFLKSYYGLSFSFCAKDFLISHNWDQKAASTAGVIIKEEQQGEIELGIYFHESIIEKSNDPDFKPFEQISSQQLDTFWILVEEVSHFLLIAQRSQMDHRVSQLELERQADIDKILISDILCHQQYKQSYFEALLHKLFFEAKNISEDRHYDKASRLAWQFFSLLLKKQRKVFMGAEQIKRALIREYHKL